MRSMSMALTLLLLFHPALLFPQKSPRHRFSHTENTYTFSGTFRIRADPACLLTILYEFDHFRQFMSHVKDIRCTRKGTGWYEVRYRYSRIFYSAETTFRRTLDLKKWKVDYEMISIRQSGLITPDIISITGYYSLTPEADGFRVTFFQQGKLASRMLSGVFFYHAEKEAIGFLKKMRQYARTHCH
ncbi:hypothetical protein DENIS_1447 [Desulfonema ishimotonii]|uniref:Ribosome association toxin RatA n=2 Tax=Desulfonema ishimotonii TaxID=45657 RepID=A0A401FU67_9BACT|nr:hypothetical protein DENIS_1447 [Desulfonema ishimotonii]